MWYLSEQFVFITKFLQNFKKKQRSKISISPQFKIIIPPFIVKFVTHEIACFNARFFTHDLE